MGEIAGAFHISYLIHGKTLNLTLTYTYSKRVKGTIIDLEEFATLVNTQDDKNKPISVLIRKC